MEKPAVGKDNLGFLVLMPWMVAIIIINYTLTIYVD